MLGDWRPYLLQINISKWEIISVVYVSKLMLFNSEC